MRGAQLSPRQQRFVAEYLVDCNGTQAAIRSGYGRSGAHVEASRLLKDPKVASAVRAGQIKLRNKLSITRDGVLSGLLEAVEAARAQQDPSAMIRAWSEIARMCGLYEPERKVDIRARSELFQISSVLTHDP